MNCPLCGEPVLEGETIAFMNGYVVHHDCAIETQKQADAAAASAHYDYENRG